MKTRLNCSLIRKIGEKSTELPIFASDDWDAYKMLAVYGIEEQPEYKGRRRPPNPKKVPPPDLSAGR